MDEYAVIRQLKFADAAEETKRRATLQERFR
jgi:hypothetical protein